ncbi:hypothetical protein [Edaphovirga cremea]|uniref:hypothetical protein n=1 Tax=Edaphovirga cremea TaxID=2267246 RepID=UPI003989DE40
MKKSVKLSALSITLGMAMLTHFPLYANGTDYKYSLTDGIDICFKKVKEKLGDEAKVSTIRASFASGGDIDPRSANRPQGVMTTCTVTYQNPEDPKKLLSMRMDTRSGEFKKPALVEIRVMGDASKFNVNDYLISLDKVVLTPLTAFMTSQEKNLSEHYSKFAWTGVSLSAPGTFSNVHHLRIDVEGRLAVNDIKESGYADISVDGKKVNKNRLIK